MVTLTSDAKRYLCESSFALLILPISVLFLVRKFIESNFQVEKAISDSVAVVIAVVTVQLVLLWSCLRAFRPEEDEQLETEQASKKKD